MATVLVSGPMFTFSAGAATVPQKLFGSSAGTVSSAGVQAGEVATSAVVATVVSV